MSVNTIKSSILTLFREPQGSVYKIPKYQRAYSWTSEEVEEFCDDLNELASNEKDTYFFGAMLYIENGNVNEIVDGQQRMTTFTLLISQLYNLCESIIREIDRQDQNDKQIRKYKKIKDKLKYDKGDLANCFKNNDTYKLELSKVDREFFYKLLNISDKVELINIGNIIIENIENKEKINTNTDIVKSFHEDIDKEVCKIFKKIIKNNELINGRGDLILIDNIPRLKEIPSDITYDEYKKIYYECYVNKLKNFIEVDNYTNEKIEISLLVEYIKNRLKNKCIDLYIEEHDYITEEDKNKFIDFLNFNSKELDIESHIKLNDAYEIINYKIIKPIVNEKNIDEKINKFSTFIEKFIRKTYIANIPENNRDTAYTMFEVLNDRGKDLGVLELLRPHILQRLEGNESYQNEVGLIWDSICSDKKCKNYLLNYLASYMPISNREKKLHNKYKEKFFDDSKSEREIYDKMIQIKCMKDVYLKIKEGEWPYENSKVDEYSKNRLYQIIKVLEYKSSIPLLMAIFETGSEEDFIFSIDILERVVFRYITICDMKPGKLTSKYSEIISDIRTNNKFDRDKFKITLGFLLNDKGADINSFKEKIDSEKMYYKRNGKNKIIKYFLCKIEDYYNDYYQVCTGVSKKTILDKPYKGKIIQESIHIEHIYPYKAENEIVDMEKIKNNIGNLTLLEKELNKNASNKELKLKQPYYKQETIRITRILDGETKLPNTGHPITCWNKKEYENRLELYRDIASKIFTLDGK